MHTEPFVKKMSTRKLPQAAINTFAGYYKQLINGEKGFISENQIEPIQKGQLDLWQTNSSYTSIGEQALNRTVILKLNGGLGTTMGLQGPKSLIPVKDQLTFLDITALQAINLNKKISSRVPLILMNSFKTDTLCSQFLQKYSELHGDIPVSFVQNMFPRIDVSTLAPVTVPQDPQLEWNPSGHGDIYTSLKTSGILDQLIEHGYLYAFISNIDNLGASLDTGILGYFISNKLSFLMEVTDRTWMDRKGGHLARHKDGRLILREAAQCPEQDRQYFQDISRHSYFNTNNLWINLLDLKKLLDENNNILNLPMICNRKKIDPTDPDSAEVFQLESAMGTAISIFSNASALRVSRSRFAPVKTCEELLLLWSDYYLLNDDYHIIHNPARRHENMGIKLDPQYYSWIEQLKERFPHEAPSLLECNSLQITGDIKFGRGISIKGAVSICNRKKHQIIIPDFTHIESDLHFE
ncbi:MAG: UTP--glucose-1-phosphate uridylyltransferase [Fibrobacter sp.]|jgi:UTP--glucose-1-phosphate uridylyltransferase|nr:UTP--glucose-1-phosphate uridylyltransferase [Fibrobacter sp.]